MMIKRLFFLLSVAGLMFSCQFGDESIEADYFILKGKMDHAEHLLLSLEELTTTDLIPVDSFETNAYGEFSYRGNLQEAGYFILRLDRDNYITLVVEPGENIYITGDANSFHINHTIQGSAGSVLLSDLQRNLHRNYKKVDSLTMVFRESQYQPNFYEVRKDLQQTYRDIVEDQREFVKNFIRNNPRSLASIIALYQYFGNTLLLNEQDHFEYFVLLSESLSEEYPANRHVLDLSRRVTHQQRQEFQRQLNRDNLAAGSPAPEIILPDPDGEMVALSSLRGNYVLIDFWATWCAPCRKGNQLLKDVYERFQPMGFEIYAISLDRTREQWLNGIESDGVTWTQVSDLRFWNSPVVNLYSVERIPYNILIDPEGRILDKGITHTELENILSEVFQIDSGS
ncbi:MAG: AhpC/TSA family protein [Bacteroidia bacterium]|nr:MAG: AhpC/TSA family protein [Bacteroidia bacterium]